MYSLADADERWNKIAALIQTTPHRRRILSYKHVPELSGILYVSLRVVIINTTFTIHWGSCSLCIPRDNPWGWWMWIWNSTYLFCNPVRLEYSHEWMRSHVAFSVLYTAHKAMTMLCARILRKYRFIQHVGNVYWPAWSCILHHIELYTLP